MVFRHILHHWLRSQAHETVAREVRKAAAEQLTRAREASDSAGGAGLACDVGIVFALEIEAGGLVDLLDGAVTTRGQGFVARRGLLRARQVAVVTSGAGTARARRATEALVDVHRPRWIISAGFAGGLSPALARHDLLMADSLVDGDGQQLPFDLRIDPATLPGEVHVGLLLTVEKVVHRPEEKRRLGEQSGALAVDTETAAVAEICRERGVPMLGVRIVTDAVAEQLPADVQHLTDQPSLAGQLGAALGAVLRRPKAVKDLWALKETALVGSDRLAKFLTRLVETLVPLD
jgi:adenosylhomocysteine nucleosidase